MRTRASPAAPAPDGFGFADQRRVRIALDQSLGAWPALVAAGGGAPCALGVHAPHRVPGAGQRLPVRAERAASQSSQLQRMAAARWRDAVLRRRAARLRASFLRHRFAHSCATALAPWRRPLSLLSLLSQMRAHASHSLAQRSCACAVAPVAPVAPTASRSRAASPRCVSAHGSAAMPSLSRSEMSAVIGPGPTPTAPCAARRRLRWRRCRRG